MNNANIITEPLRLSPHFTLGEMTDSGTARERHIDNTPTPEAVDNLRALCCEVLEPLRSRFGRTIISSGYRSRALNEAVHGAANSQHLRGEAADINCSSLSEARRRFEFIRDNLDFDQLLLEERLCIGTCWLHVSYVRQPGRRPNRHDAHFLDV